ncbi:hypothetical protein J2T12_005435 [Paenibacillus anaericanus]|nr:hypothetical protein [Paenibacillus anaericanus]
MANQRSKDASNVFLVIVALGVFYTVFYTVFTLYSIHGQ